MSQVASLCQYLPVCNFSVEISVEILFEEGLTEVLLPYES